MIKLILLLIRSSGLFQTRWVKSQQILLIKSFYLHFPDELASLAGPFPDEFALLQPSLLRSWLIKFYKCMFS